MPQSSLSGLFRRFVWAVRQEGLRGAVRRSLRFFLRRMTGQGRATAVPVQGAGTQPVDRYLNGVWKTLAQADAFHIQAAPRLHRRRRQIAMIADLNLPQCRKYRVEQLAAFWRARGVEFEFAHFEDIPRAVRIMQHATHLMEYRLQTGPATEMLRYEARRLRLPILYDLDDPLFSVPAYETYRNMEGVELGMKAHFLADAPKYLSMMNGADILSVSTPGMAAEAAMLSDRQIFVRRNFADQETLRHRAFAEREREKGCFRVAFASGSQGHEIDLKEIITPLSEFILAAPERRLMVIGHFDQTHLPKSLLPQVEQVKFTDYGTYLATLAQADCAVMPLCDDAFNNCKSAVRVLDAAAAAVPSIVSPVGDLSAVVRAGETGFIAENNGDWSNALKELAADPLGARNMGLLARRNVEENWQASPQPHIIAPELLDWVEA